jgi:hypothetical protein
MSLSQFVAVSAVAVAIGAPVWATPTLLNPGLHLIAVDGSSSRWLGPGMDPAWSTDGKLLYVQAAHGPLSGLPLGPLYTVAVDTAEARPLPIKTALGTARPSPDGRWLAALSAGAPPGAVALTVLTRAGAPVGPPLDLGPFRPALVASLRWSGPGEVCCDRWRWNVAGGEPQSDAPPPPEAAFTVRRTPTGGQVVAADGRVLAEIDPLVPLTDPFSDWPSVPALSPDGKWLAVSLGRTDRWGLAEGDIAHLTDTNVAGRVCRVTRRLRDVGPSGVVCDSARLAFRGQDAPTAESTVVTETRPGAMRWERPAPPRWVVLHHTGTGSDAASLNALTTSGPFRLGSLYQDITGSGLAPEPGTLAVHYVVRRGGGVCQLVPERLIARHVGTGQWRNRGPIYDFNTETIGIEIVSPGNDYTAAQVQSVGRLVADICRRQGIPFKHVGNQSFVEGVIYHKDVSAGLRGKPDPSGWPWDSMAAAGEAFLHAQPKP